MKIKPRADQSTTSVVVATPRVRTRPIIELASPSSPPPTLGSWVIDVHVHDASIMFQRAAEIMLAAGKTPGQINSRLCHGHGDETVVDVAECLKVLFEIMYRGVESLTGCKIDEPQLYLEPLAPL